MGVKVWSSGKIWYRGFWLMLNVLCSDIDVIIIVLFFMIIMIVWC